MIIGFDSIVVIVGVVVILALVWKYLKPCPCCADIHVVRHIEEAAWASELNEKKEVTPHDK